MKPILFGVGAIIFAACLLTGCGQSSSTSKETTSSPPSAPSTPVAANSPTASVPPNTPEPAAPAATTPADNTQAPPTAPASAPTDAASAQDALAAPATQFAAAAAAQPDAQAASIGSELASKAKSLSQSAGANPDLKSRLGSALQSLSAGKDASALGTIFQQAKQANLTPQQTQLVKDVGNLASAYVVQRNFSTVDGAQGDVATIVNSLRKGSVAQALPSLKSLAQNASLTSQQKDLLGSVADQFAPGFLKASGSLKQGLQSLQGLTK